MAQKFVTNLDLNSNQLLNATLQKVDSDPSVGNFEGRLIYHTGEDVIKVYSGSAWRTLIASVGQANGDGGVVSGGTHSTALTISQSNGQITVTPNLATSGIAGLLSASDFSKLAASTSEATASTLILRDVNGKAKVTVPTEANHIATKDYVDSARQGLDVKQSVRAATNATVNLSTDVDNGSIIDGVTLATGDRILIKDQGVAGAAHADNGIYVVQASGAPVRASDSNGTADTGELKPGTFTFVEEGTVNSDKGFVLSTNGTITVGSTAITWTQFSGAGSFTAGDGLSQNGNTINVNVTANRTAITADAIDIASTYVGQSSITTLGTITTGVWNGTDVGIEHGGTNSSTAAGARTNLGIATSAGVASTSTPVLARIAKQACSADVAGTSTTTVTHLFGTTDVIVQVYQVSTGETVIGDVVRTSSDVVTVTLLGTISSGAFTIVVTG